MTLDRRLSAVLLLSVSLAVLLGWVITLREVRDRYDEQRVRIAMTASNALRLGHEAQRALSIDWKPGRLTGSWRTTHHRLSLSIAELVDESRRLPHSTRTRALVENTGRAWTVVERKIDRADRALSLLAASPISHLVDDRSIRRIHHRSWEYPHNLNGQLVYYTGLVVRSFEELAISSEIFEIATSELLVAVATEASVVEGRIRAAIWMVTILAGSLTLLISLILIRALRYSDPNAHRLDSTSRVTENSSSSTMAHVDEVSQALPHWLSHAIERYRLLPCLDEGKDQFIVLSGRSCEHVGRIVKQRLGMSLSDLLTHERLRRAVDMLQNGDETVSAISKSVGFHNESYFYRCFRNAYGVTPAQYRNLNAAGRYGRISADTETTGSSSNGNACGVNPVITEVVN
ncbi:MAG: AraC family transcriptional regulator [Spirochaetaceae bacterium]|nr:MAG: AraC family transcriptional regulator [Spirochaetaceae bacterium]